MFPRLQDVRLVSLTNPQALNLSRLILTVFQVVETNMKSTPALNAKMDTTKTIQVSVSFAPSHLTSKKASPHLVSNVLQARDVQSVQKALFWPILRTGVNYQLTTAMCLTRTTLTMELNTFALIAPLGTSLTTRTSTFKLLQSLN